MIRDKNTLIEIETIATNNNNISKSLKSETSQNAFNSLEFNIDATPSTANIVRDVRNSDPTGRLERYINLYLTNTIIKPFEPELLESGSHIKNTVSNGFGSILNVFGRNTALELSNSFDEYKTIISKSIDAVARTPTIKKNKRAENIVTAKSFLDNAKKMLDSFE